MFELKYHGDKLCRHQDSNPQPSNPLLFRCSRTFNAGIGLVPYRQALSSSQSSGGLVLVAGKHTQSLPS